MRTQPAASTGLDAYCDHNSGTFPVLALPDAGPSELELHQLAKARQGLNTAAAHFKFAREAWLDSRGRPEAERHELLVTMRLRESAHAAAMGELLRLQGTGRARRMVG